jgi:hypothetical protein
VIGIKLRSSVAVQGGSALCLSVTDARDLLVCSVPVIQPASS